jgi:SAM-dependent methyltransferase
MVVDAWNEAEAYEPFIGRWSRPIARDFVAWLEIPSGLKWLDVGCGTGALCETILQDNKPAELVGIDRSSAYVSYAANRVNNRHVRFEVGDATALPVADNVFDATVSGLMLNFIPEPGRAVGEMVRASRPGGVVAAYVWDYAAGMEMLRCFWDAACRLDPNAAAHDEGNRFPICQPAALRSLFRESALSSIGVTAIDAPTKFRSFDDYWSPFLGGQGPAPSYVRSLSESDRGRLREALEQRLVIEQDDGIHLSARAWAVKGTKSASAY